MTRETKRQLLHIALIGCAFFLPYLGKVVAAGCAFAAVVFNLTLLPRLVPSLFRRGEGRFSGVTLYPFSVLLLVLFFPLPVAAAAWAVMALGDGAATIIGTKLNGPRLPWNRAKSWSGLLAFLLAAFPAAYYFYGWLAGDFGPATACLVIAGVFAGALVESLPLTVDDNLSVPLAVGIVIWLGTLYPAAQVVTTERLLLALAINLPVALIALLAGQVSKKGFLAGLPLGVVMLCWSGWPGYLALVSFYILANWATKIGYRRKKTRGSAQEKGGRRGAKHALANCLVGAGAALAYYLSGESLFMVALVASFATAAFDTVSGELGQLFPGKPRSLLTFRRVPVGESGAVSLGGTLCGVAAAGLVALVPYLAGGLAGRWLAVVLCGATMGALAESYLALSMEKRGLLDNEELNFINTLIGAVVAFYLAGWL